MCEVKVIRTNERVGKRCGAITITQRTTANWGSVESSSSGTEQSLLRPARKPWAGALKTSSWCMFLEHRSSCKFLLPERKLHIAVVRSLLQGVAYPRQKNYIKNINSNLICLPQFTKSFQFILRTCPFDTPNSELLKI